MKVIQYTFQTTRCIKKNTFLLRRDFFIFSLCSLQALSLVQVHRLWLQQSCSKSEWSPQKGLCLLAFRSTKTIIPRFYPKKITLTRLKHTCVDVKSLPFMFGGSKVGRHPQSTPSCQNLFPVSRRGMIQGGPRIASLFAWRTFSRWLQVLTITIYDPQRAVDLFHDIYST